MFFVSTFKLRQRHYLYEFPCVFHLSNRKNKISQENKTEKIKENKTKTEKENIKKWKNNTQ